MPPTSTPPYIYGQLSYILSLLSNHVLLVAILLCTSLPVAMALEGTASVFAIVSLSLQLIECVDKIRTFIKGVKQARAELESLLGTLDVLASTIQSIRDAPPDGNSLSRTAVMSGLQNCEDNLGPLKEMADKYSRLAQQQSSSRRQLWNDLKFAMKAQEIRDIKDKLQHSATFLTLDRKSTRLNSSHWE